MIGVKVGDVRAAIPKKRIQDAGTVEFTLAGTPLQAVWDAELAAAQVVPQDGDEVAAVVVLDVMWFAWYAFYPDTQIIE